MCECECILDLKQSVQYCVHFIFFVSKDANFSSLQLILKLSKIKKPPNLELITVDLQQLSLTRFLSFYLKVHKQTNKLPRLKATKNARGEHQRVILIDSYNERLLGPRRPVRATRNSRDRWVRQSKTCNSSSDG